MPVFNRPASMNREKPHEDCGADHKHSEPTRARHAALAAWLKRRTTLSVLAARSLNCVSWKVTSLRVRGKYRTSSHGSPPPRYAAIALLAIICRIELYDSTNF